MRSIIADSIIREQKMKEFYEKKKRQKCKEKDCTRCQFEKVCTENEEFTIQEEQK